MGQTVYSVNLKLYQDRAFRGVSLGHWTTEREAATHLKEFSLLGRVHTDLLLQT